MKLTKEMWESLSEAARWEYFNFFIDTAVLKCNKKKNWSKRPNATLAALGKILQRAGWIDDLAK